MARVIAAHHFGRHRRSRIRLARLTAGAQPWAPKLKSRDGVGIRSSAAASDLYGLGVRAGFYVQGLRILINLPRNLEDSGAGLKLACGGISLSLLVSRIILAAQANISSAKAFLVLSLVFSLACKTVICCITYNFKNSSESLKDFAVF
jgi:hypothetical protein